MFLDGICKLSTVVRPRSSVESSSADVATSAAATSDSGSDDASSSRADTGVQRYQQLSVASYVTQPMGPLRQNKVDEELVKMIAFSIMEDKGFRAFTKTLNPFYSLPKRKTLAKTMLPHLYDKIRAELMDKVNSK